MSKNKHYNPQNSKRKRVEEILDILSQVMMMHKRIKPRTAESVLLTMNDILMHDATVLVEDEIDGVIHVDIKDRDDMKKKTGGKKYV